MAALRDKHVRDAITVIVPAAVVFELEDKMSVDINREMRRHAACEDKRDETVGPMGQLGRALARWWLRRRAIAELEAMDDMLLRDMGIYRSDIPHVVDGLSERGLTRSARTPQKSGNRKQAANTDNRGSIAA